MNLSGAQVSLYGQTYSTFYVGSNGYITFTAGDTDYTESLSDHFGEPRISALFDDLNPVDRRHRQLAAVRGSRRRDLVERQRIQHVEFQHVPD